MASSDQLRILQRLQSTASAATLEGLNVGQASLSDEEDLGLSLVGAKKGREDDEGKKPCVLIHLSKLYIRILEVSNIIILISSHSYNRIYVLKVHVGQQQKYSFIQL